MARAPQLARPVHPVWLLAVCPRAFTKPRHAPVGRVEADHGCRASTLPADHVARAHRLKPFWFPRSPAYQQSRLALWQIQRYHYFNKNHNSEPCARALAMTIMQMSSGYPGEKSRIEASMREEFGFEKIQKHHKKCYFEILPLTGWAHSLTRPTSLAAMRQQCLWGCPATVRLLGFRLLECDAPTQRDFRFAGNYRESRMCCAGR